MGGIAGLGLLMVDGYADLDPMRSGQPFCDIKNLVC